MVYRKRQWTQEEDELLSQIYLMPSLTKYWNIEAKKRQWVSRSRDSLNKRIHTLRTQGLVGSRVILDEADGWICPQQLANRLGISLRKVKNWMALGLPSQAVDAYLREEDKGRISVEGGSARRRINMKRFLKWATSPSGAALISPAIADNPIAINWLMIQAGNFMIISKK